MPRLADPEGKGTARVTISTPLPESAVAEYLTRLAARVEPRGIKVGSYPRWGKKRNTVTLVGRYVVILIVYPYERGDLAASPTDLLLGTRSFSRALRPKWLRLWRGGWCLLKARSPRSDTVRGFGN